MIHPVFAWIVEGLAKTWGARVLRLFGRRDEDRKRGTLPEPDQERRKGLRPEPDQGPNREKTK